MPAEFQPKAILRALNRHEVDFVVIGGLAGIAQGSVLPSFDLDIAYARDRSNLERLAEVLLELDATLRGAPPDLPFTPDARTLEKGSHFAFETRYGSLDLRSDPVGAPKYPQLKSAAVRTEIDGERVLVAALDHLIAMKEALGCEKDKYMAREYRTLAMSTVGTVDRETHGPSGYAPARCYAVAASSASPSRMYRVAPTDR